MAPTVSIIVPCFNEEKIIGQLLGAICAQTHPVEDMEVIIADGMSTDRTRDEIASFAKCHPELLIEVVDNPKRIIPAALNIALRVSRGKIIMRLDGHSVPKDDYVERCVWVLNNHLCDNVGGIWKIKPGAENWRAYSIAAAATHPLGVGDALYRYAQQPGYVDTVPFGAFRRNLIERTGMFDEDLLTNEDYEFNARIRELGGKIWLDPAIQSDYYARSNFRELAKQYWRYGYWKFKMLRRHPKTLRWRQGLPPLFVASLVAGAIAGFAWKGFHILLGAEAALYALSLLSASVLAASRQKKWYLIAGLPISIAIMHLCWGSGFIWSIISPQSSSMRGGES